MTRPSLRLVPALVALLSASALLPVLAGPSQAPTAPVTAGPAQGAIALATTLLDHLDAGRFAQAEALFSPEMRAAVPANKLQQVWASLAQSVGPAGPRGTPATTVQGDMTVVSVPLPFTKAHLVARVTADANGQIAGFLVQPAPPPAAAPTTSAAYVEREMTVGNGDRALPATLTLPKGASAKVPVPAVVLVHGSGPHDRDETIGPNRPFLDIARGLAEKGIAVLRYDKRTKARPQDLAGTDFTVDDEVTRDAVDAIASLRAVDAIDRKRVFVLGHSLGGMLAPRIAGQSGQVAGAVLMAAPARSVLDLLLEQNQRLANRDGSVNAQEQAALDDLQARVHRIRTVTDVAARETPLGLPAGYWRSLERIDPVADAKALDLPLLVLHGGRDIQVVDADWQRWQRELSQTPNARLRLYPGLNHLGIAGTGPGNVEEYFVAGNVEPQLIDDIAGWIHRP
ncbi:alpha/beta hydrolase [Lysobacter olei]